MLKLQRSVYYYQSQARDSQALSGRIREITQTRVHYGYRRVHVLLRREGFRDNHKRVYRLYREQGLSLRCKRPKRNKAVQPRQPRKPATQENQIWSMDFVADNLFDGRKLRMLTVVDCYSRQSLAIHVGQRLTGEDVVEVLNHVVAQRGKPQTIKTDNAMVESFNGRLRQECLNEHWFMSLADAKSKIEAWRQHHNETRPHSALNWLSPNEFARSSPVNRATSSN